MVQVFNTETGQEVATWRLPGSHSRNFPMCVAPTLRRIFVGTRNPAANAAVIVLDMDSGAVVASVPCVGDMDDLWWDDQRQRLYVIGGVGAVSVIQREEPKATTTSVGIADGPLLVERYKVISEVSTGIGARTGIWYPERDRLYVAVPATADALPKLLVYEPT